MDSKLTPSEKENLFKYMDTIVPKYNSMEEFGINTDVLTDTAKNRIMQYMQDAASDMLFGEK